MLAETDEILLAEIAERRADPDLASREDILSLLVGARFEDGSAMSDAELRDQLMTLLMAGHETTATASPGRSTSCSALPGSSSGCGPRWRRAATSTSTR